MRLARCERSACAFGFRESVVGVDLLLEGREERLSAVKTSYAGIVGCVELVGADSTCE